MQSPWEDCHEYLQHILQPNCWEKQVQTVEHIVQLVWTIWVDDAEFPILNLSTSTESDKTTLSCDSGDLWENSSAKVPVYPACFITETSKYDW